MTNAFARSIQARYRAVFFVPCFFLQLAKCKDHRSLLDLEREPSATSFLHTAFIQGTDVMIWFSSQHKVAAKEREEDERTTKQKMAR